MTFGPGAWVRRSRESHGGLLMPRSVSLIELVRVVQETRLITIRTQVILTHRQDGEVLTRSEGFVMSPRVLDLGKRT